MTVRSAEHNGRLRKYYRLTPQGASRIGEFLREWGEIAAVYEFVAKEDAAHDES